VLGHGFKVSDVSDVSGVPIALLFQGFVFHREGVRAQRREGIFTAKAEGNFTAKARRREGARARGNFITGARGRGGVREFSSLRGEGARVRG